MPLTETEEKQQLPSRQMMRFFPDAQDAFMRSERPKMRPLESNYARPYVSYDRCDLQLFRFYLCARNMSQTYAEKIGCKLEAEDLQECKFGMNRMKRKNVLRAASSKVNDRIPGLYGERFWLH